MKYVDQLIQIDPHPDPVVLEETMKAGEKRLRRIDILERWVKDGVIEPRHRAAGMQFQNDFYVAGLVERFSMQALDRVDTSSTEYEPTAVIEAKDRIRQAMYVLGQINGTAAWDILGLGHGLGAYAQNHRWTGKNTTVARGILIGTLDALANHYRC
jgi:hypothetical protein